MRSIINNVHYYWKMHDTFYWHHVARLLLFRFQSQLEFWVGVTYMIFPLIRSKRIIVKLFIYYYYCILSDKISADKTAEISTWCRKCCPPKFCLIRYIHHAVEMLLFRCGGESEFHCQRSVRVGECFSTHGLNGTHCFRVGGISHETCTSRRTWMRKEIILHCVRHTLLPSWLSIVRNLHHETNLDLKKNK